MPEPFPGSGARPALSGGPGAIFTESELLARIGRGEGHFLAFESAWDWSDGTRRPRPRREVRDRIAEVVASFANADGGLLLLGVDDDGTPSGHGYPDTVVEGLLAVPSKRLDRRVSCRAARGRIGDAEVLIFETGMAPEAVMVEENRFPRRFGEHLTLDPPEAINAGKRASRRVDFEQRLRADATLDSLDLEAVRRFMERTPLREEPVREALEHYGLVRRGLRGPEITNGALLLFGRRPGFRWHPRADIRLLRVAGVEERRGLRWQASVVAVLRPPVLTALREARPFFEAQFWRQGPRNGSDREAGGEIPPAAWGEALLNAVAHRDYEDENRGVEVWFHEDRVEFRSPGGVRPAVLTALREGRPTHTARNPLLVSALTAAGIMRDEGEGLLRIRHEMAARSLPPPEIAVEDGVFGLRLFRGRRGTGEAPERAAAGVGS